MRLIYSLLGILLFNNLFSQNHAENTREKYVLVIHGGAGTILKSQMTPEREQAFREALTLALQ